MRRLAAVILLVGPVMVIGVLPVRTLVPEVWPRPVEELVLTDGSWILQPAGWIPFSAPGGDVQARTRPLSVIEVELRDGSRERGYLIDKTSGPDGQLTLQTGRGQQRTLPVSTTTLIFSPNDMPWNRRIRLALARLKNRLPVNRKPSLQ